MTGRTPAYLELRRKQFTDLTLKLVAIFEQDGFEPEIIYSQKETIQYLSSSFFINAHGIQLCIEISLVEIEKLKCNYVHELEIRALCVYPQKLIYVYNTSIGNLREIADIVNSEKFYNKFKEELTP